MPFGHGDHPVLIFRLLENAILHLSFDTVPFFRVSRIPGEVPASPFVDRVCSHGCAIAGGMPLMPQKLVKLWPGAVGRSRTSVPNGERRPCDGVRWRATARRFVRRRLAAGTLFGDTWVWDSESWTQVQDIGPSARAFHAVAYDSARSRVVFFGGKTVARVGRHAWDGDDWTQVEDSARRRDSGM